jgi:hypothetical protein
MNEEISPPPGAPDESAEARELRELQSQVASYRGAIHVMALCGTVIAASYFLYVHKQVEGIQRQSAELSGYLADYQKNFVPQFEAARSNLANFARTNPSVAPILQKYFATNGAAAKAP